MKKRESAFYAVVVAALCGCGAEQAMSDPGSASDSDSTSDPEAPFDGDPVGLLDTSNAGHSLAAEVSFDTTEVGRSAARSVVVVHRGRAKTGALSATLTGAAAADFTVAASSTCPGLALKRDESCRFDLVFRPTIDGDRAAALIVAATPGGQLTFGLRGQATPVPPPPDELAITIAGGGAGEVLVTDLATSDTLAVCTASCKVPVAPGQQIEIAASSVSTYGGLSGACTTQDARCSFTAGTGTSAVTASFIADPKERWTLLPGGGEIITAAYDSGGNLVIGTNGITKLSPSGAVVWRISLGACTLAIGPADTIYAQTTTQVVKLDAAGATLWTRPLDPRAVGCGDTFDGFVHNLAVGRDGAVAIQGDTGVARWDADGNLSWSAALPNDDEYGVAIDADGVVNAAVLDPSSGESIALARFAADGTPLEPVDRLTSQYHGMFFFDAANDMIATASGHSHTDFFGGGAGASVRIPDPDFAPNGVCSSGTGDVGWVYQLDDFFFFARDWVVNRYRGGQRVWTLSRSVSSDLFGEFGTIPMDIAEDANGNIAIVGSYTGVATMGGWIQTFAP